MGVIKITDHLITPERIEDNLNEYILDESSDEESFHLEVQSLPATPRRRRRGCRKAQLPAVGRSTAEPKRMGAKKRRRYENSRLLTLNALIDPEDICDDLSDMLPETISAFTKLFLEKDNMALWNEFIEKSEEEQQLILDGRAQRTATEGHVLGGRGIQPRGGDARSAHPAYAAEACFRRIDARFKSLLAKEHLPLGVLERYETELSEFFSSMPDGVWVQAMQHGFDRLMLHAVAQYLALKSQSYDSAAGQRQTQVENPRPFFVAPRETLASFLQRKRSKS